MLGSFSPGRGLSTAAPATSAGHRPPVLVLCADDPAEPWIHGIMDGVNGFISSSQSTRPELYFEFLDRLRLDGARQQQLTRDAIVTKYADTPFELIVVVQREAFTFATSIRDEQLAGRADPVRVIRRQQVDGSAAPRRHGAHVREQLRDDTVLGDSDSFRRRGTSRWCGSRRISTRNLIRRAGLTPIEVREASLERFQQVLGDLPPHTIAILGGAGRQDVAGERPVNPAWPLCEVASAAANSPTFMQGSAFSRLRHRRRPAPGFRAHGPRALANASSRGWRAAKRRARRFRWQRLREPSSMDDNSSAGTCPNVRCRSAVSSGFAGRICGAIIGSRSSACWSRIGVQTLLIVVLILERNRRRVAEAEGQENLMIAARAERQVLTGTLAGAIAHELRPTACVDSAQCRRRRGPPSSRQRRNRRAPGNPAGHPNGGPTRERDARAAPRHAAIASAGEAIRRPSRDCPREHRDPAAGRPVQGYFDRSAWRRRFTR